MWAQRLCAPFSFDLVDVPRPDAAALADRHVLLATAAAAICGSDLPRFAGSWFPQRDARGGWAPPGPGFPIHEVVGTVIESKHPAHQPGDMVVGWASRFDGLAEFVIADGEGLAGYDRTLAPTTAVMLQPLACVLYAADQLGDVRGKHVAVVGQGPIGLLFSHVLKARGAGRVVGVDRVHRPEAKALFGVDDSVTAAAEVWARSLSESERPSVVVEAVGHQVGTMKSCLDAVAFGGEVFYFGIPDDHVYPFDMMTFLRKNLTLRAGATIERRRVLEAADTYLAVHPGLREQYVTDVFAAQDAQRAFEAAAAPKTGQLKIAIDMS